MASAKTQYKLSVWVTRKDRPNTASIYVEGVGYGKVLDVMDNPTGGVMIKAEFIVSSVIETMVALDNRFPSKMVH